MISLLYILSLCACDSHKGLDISKGNNFIEIQIPEKPTNHNNIPLSSVVDSFYYIPLSNKSLIGGIDKLLHYKDKIYILDEMNKSIIIFNEDGEELIKLQKIGKGPGEYTQLFDFVVDKKTDQIIVYCYPRKILYFDQNFVQIKEVSFKHSYQYFAFQNDFYFFQRSYNETYAGETDNYLLHGFNNGLDEIKRSYIPFKNYQLGTTFTYGSPFFYNSKEVIFCDEYENKAYGLAKDSIYIKYYFNSNRRNMPDGLCLKMKDNFEKLKSYNFGLTNLYETKDAVAFSYFQGSQLFVTAIYQKSSKRLIYPNLITTNDINFLSWGALIKGTKNDFFVQVADAYDFRKLIDKYREAIKNAVDVDVIKKNKAVENFNQFLENHHIDKVKLNDNPILIYFSVKKS